MIEHDLQKKIFDEVVRLLTERGLILKKGTIVDSTFIEAPSSTKNQKKERDPEAHSSKKGNTWHFGYKAHIRVDRESGLVHHVSNEKKQKTAERQIYKTFHGVFIVGIRIQNSSLPMFLQKTS